MFRVSESTLLMPWCRTAGAVIAGLLLALSWSQLGPPDAIGGRDHLVKDGVPVTLLLPENSGASDGRYPGVVVAHGFAGSRRMMLGYGYSLASAGYAVALPDFSGHGANGTILSRSRDTVSSPLQHDIDAALGVLRERPEVDPRRIAVLGHSMGSGAAMAAAIAAPDTYGAVVAVSPTDAPVTEALPRDLLLQAGAWEPRFLANARRLLAAAGGRSTTGNRRSLEVIPNVEHITIVYSQRSQRSAVEWIGESLGNSRQSGYADRRLLWYGLFTVAVVMFMVLLSPILRRLAPERPDRGAGGLPALRGSRGVPLMMLTPVLAGALTGGGATLAANLNDGALPAVLGLSVGGFVGLWALIMGALWLAMGVRPALPRPKSLLLGLVSFAVLWLTLGLAGQQVLFQWILVPYRLARWPLLSLWVLPWLLAAGYLHVSATRIQRLGIYLGQTVAIVAVLALHGDRKSTRLNSSHYS